jgi:gliding motility-associated protein GldM
MSLPREPRQKMINMMYLVLTALLALNVSAEILNAFKTVNNSLEKTNTVVNASSNDLMSSLKDKLNEPGSRERANIWYPKAQQVQGFAKTANDFIQGLKDEILTKSGGDPKDPTKNYKDDNLDVPTRIMIDKHAGKDLLQKLTEFRTNVLGLDPKVKAQFEQSLPIDLAIPKSHQNSSNKSWEFAYFHMVPAVAALTILSKFQNDVKVSENKVIAFCHEQVGKVEIVFNQYEPIIGQNSKVLLPGQELEITAGLAAFNSDKKPDVYINGSKITLNDKGLADWKNTVNSSGKVPVRVEFMDQEGKQQTKSFDVEYTVGQSNAAVQLDKMNVLFIGVDNPVTVSGSGSVDQLKVGMSGGGAGSTLNGSNGHYVARVTQESDNCTINVTTTEGKTTPVRFRIRSIPDPTPYVGQVKSGEMSAAAFKSQAGVRAIVENFFYETQFNVISFRMTGDGEGFPEGVEEKVNSGAAWKEAAGIISKVKPGSFITIEDIRAVGPDNRTRKLTPMIFNLK